MGKMVKTLQQSIEAINYASFALLLFLLPFPWHYIQPVMAIWLVSWALEFRWVQKKNFHFHKGIIPLLLIAAFVGWETLSLCWGTNVSHGLDILQKHIIILAIILISLFGTNHFYNSIKLKSALYIGCLVSVLVYFTLVYWCLQLPKTHPWIILPFRWDTIGHFPIGIIEHQLYCCIPFTLALCFSGSLYRHYKARYSPISALVTIGIGDIILIGAIILSSCRTMILILPILAIIGILLHFKGWKKWICAGISLVGIAVTLTYLCNHNERFNKIINDVKNITVERIMDPSTQKEPRIYLWYTVVNHWKDYGIQGLGVGSAVEQINQYAREDNFPIAQQHDWGPHNFYLNTWIELGPLAVLFLLGILIATPFCHTKNIRKEVLFTTLVFGWAIFSEEMFTQIRGLYLLSAMIVLMQLLQREDLGLNHSDNNLDEHQTGHLQ